MTGNLFRAGSEKKLERLVRSALPGYFVHVQLMADPDDGTPMLAVGLDGSFSKLGAGHSGVERHEVTGLIHRIMKASIHSAKYPPRIAVKETDGSLWVYDYWRDSEPWLAES